MIGRSATTAEASSHDSHRPTLRRDGIDTAWQCQARVRMLSRFPASYPASALFLRGDQAPAADVPLSSA